MYLLRAVERFLWVNKYLFGLLEYKFLTFLLSYTNDRRFSVLDLIKYILKYIYGGIVVPKSGCTKNSTVGYTAL